MIRSFLYKWQNIRSQENTTYLTIPRAVLFVWGSMLLIFQTMIVLACFGLFVLIIGVPCLIWGILFREYYRVWKRYYSSFWPVFIHTLALLAAVYIKVRIF